MNSSGTEPCGWPPEKNFKIGLDIENLFVYSYTRQAAGYFDATGDNTHAG